MKLTDEIGTLLRLQSRFFVAMKGDFEELQKLRKHIGRHSPKTKSHIRYWGDLAELLFQGIDGFYDITDKEKNISLCENNSPAFEERHSVELFAFQCLAKGAFFLFAQDEEKGKKLIEKARSLAEYFKEEEKLSTQALGMLLLIRYHIEKRNFEGAEQLID